MRRFTLCSSVAMVALIGAVGFAQVPTKIATLADHVAVMKSNGQANGALNKSLGSGSFADAKTAAGTLRTNFTTLRAFWTEKRTPTHSRSSTTASPGSMGSTSCWPRRLRIRRPRRLREGVLRRDLRRVPQDDARGRQPDRIQIPPRRGPVQTTVRPPDVLAAGSDEQSRRPQQRPI